MMYCSFSIVSVYYVGSCMNLSLLIFLVKNKVAATQDTLENGDHKHSTNGSTELRVSADGC